MFNRFGCIWDYSCYLNGAFLLADNATHYFIILVRNGNHLVFTQMVSTHDAMVRGSLDFPNMIKLRDIKQDFKVNLEIYSMVRCDVILVRSALVTFLFSA